MITVKGERPRYASSCRSLRRVLAASAGVIAISGCFSPDLEVSDCVIPCIHECPSGSECRNNFCARTDSAATCSAVGGDGGSGGAATMDPPPAGAAGMAGSAATTPLVIEPGPTQGLCSGQSYQLEFAVSGGSAPYTWTLDAKGSDAALDTTTGTNVQISGSADPSNPKLTISVQDSRGASVTQDITLDLLTSGAGGCPTIMQTTLPAACAQNPYHASDIVVEGGTAPFIWSALSMPDGLSFDPNTQTISGSANASGSATPITLQVEDAHGHKTRRTYPLTYRDKCWFGYSASSDGDSKIHLFDPALKTRAAALESSMNNTGVVDFKFSPDGQYLVYRRATSGGARDLVLAAAPNWQERVLDFGGSILEYSWSPGALTLAVAFQDAAGNTLMGGLDADGANTAIANGTALTLLHTIQVMDPTYAPLNSELTWIQSNRYVAFHGDGFPGTGLGWEAPYFVSVDATGFSAVSSSDIPYVGAIQLQPAQNGVFAVRSDPDDLQLDFWGSALGLDYDLFVRGQFPSSVADPAGRYVAHPENNALRVLFTAESGGTDDPPTPWNSSADDCASILAWNPKREQIACDVGVTPASAGGQLRLFTLDAGTASVTGRDMKELAGYQPGDAVARRRAFSPQGSLFALTTGSDIYVADTTGWYVLQHDSAAPQADTGAPSELSFSPDESLLLWQLGGLLDVMVLQKNGPSHWFELSDPLLSPSACNEEFVAGPDHWCGNSGASSVLAWAPDSQFAAAVTAGHGLRVYDLSQFASEQQLVAMSACDAGCSADFAFQP